jgi:hypothetical protein
MTPDRLQKLVTQLKWRLMEGGGQCFYELGVRDDGAILGLVAGELDESLATLERMADSLGAQCEVVREITLIEPERSEDDDDPGPAPDNPLLAKPRQRCLATPSLDPTPEISDSETSVTSALGELARLQLTDTSEDEADDKVGLVVAAPGTINLVDDLPPSAVDPGPVIKPVYTVEQIARRQKKHARRQASRLRRSQGVPIPSPTPAHMKAKKVSRRPPKPSEGSDEGVRYAAEVLITLLGDTPSFLAFAEPFAFE